MVIVIIVCILLPLNPQPESALLPKGPWQDDAGSAGSLAKKEPKSPIIFGFGVGESVFPVGDGGHYLQYFLAVVIRALELANKGPETFSTLSPQRGRPETKQHAFPNRSTCEGPPHPEIVV